MDDIRLKPSRVQRMRDINRLHQDLKEIYEDLEQHLRMRNRLSRKVRKLAKQAKRRYPDMHVDDPYSLGLHDYLDDVARSLRSEQCLTEDPDDPVMRTGSKIRGLFRFLTELTSDVPWLKAS